MVMRSAISDKIHSAAVSVHDWSVGVSTRMDNCVATCATGGANELYILGRNLHWCAKHHPFDIGVTVGRGERASVSKM